MCPADINFMGFCIIAIAKLGLRHHQRKSVMTSIMPLTKGALRSRDVVKNETFHRQTARRVPGSIVT